MNPELSTFANSLPESSGVYQYFDSNNNLIYVGKAKNLKKRVRSYFGKKHESNKTNLLVSKISAIKYIEVSSESEALLLENNLIKKYQPKYNVLLKDDKTYPWICVKNERFPRVFYTRNKVGDNSLYFGPYTSVFMVKTLLDLTRQIFKLRNCNYYLSEENILKKKFKVCLEYHLSNCAGPCEGMQTEKEYSDNIDCIKNILKGNILSVKNYLKELMFKYSEEQRYEVANDLKEKIEIIEKYQSKSVVVSPENNNIDVYSIVEDEKSAYVNFLKVVKGAVLQFHNVEIKKRLNETSDELLPMAIIEIRNRLMSDSTRVIIPFKIDYKLSGIKFIVPRQGDKLKLLQLSIRNAKSYKNEKVRINAKINPQNKIARTLEKMKKDLNMKVLPIRIECFDNSNIQGAFPVAACVVFENGRPKKSGYRHYNIKTVTGPDDFATMEEVIFRRYSRLLKEKDKLPQLIVVDGGKGQLSSAVKTLKKLNFPGDIQIVGIAKRLEEIFLPGEILPIYIDKKSETLRVIQHIRNEAHRFGITFHKNQRSKGFLKSELDNIKGIGEITIKELLTKFKTTEAVSKSGTEELTAIVGAKRAKLICDYFNKMPLQE